MPTTTRIRQRAGRTPRRPRRPLHTSDRVALNDPAAPATSSVGTQDNDSLSHALCHLGRSQAGGGLADWQGRRSTTAYGSSPSFVPPFTKPRLRGAPLRKPRRPSVACARSRALVQSETRLSLPSGAAVIPPLADIPSGKSSSATRPNALWSYTAAKGAARIRTVPTLATNSTKCSAVSYYCRSITSHHSAAEARMKSPT